jgi:hypothetical protein
MENNGQPKSRDEIAKKLAAMRAEMAALEEMERREKE